MTILMFIVIVVAALWMANQLQIHQQEMSYTSFVEEVEEGNVTEAYINQNSAVPTGTVTVTLKGEDAARTVNVSDVEKVESLLQENDIDYGMSDVPRESMFTTIAIPLLITLCGVMLLFFLISHLGQTQQVRCRQSLLLEPVTREMKSLRQCIQVSGARREKFQKRMKGEACVRCPWYFLQPRGHLITQAT